MSVDQGEQRTQPYHHPDYPAFAFISKGFVDCFSDHDMKWHSVPLFQRTKRADHPLHRSEGGGSNRLGSVQDAQGANNTRLALITNAMATFEIRAVVGG
jgi:hypothetical protein